MEAPLAPGVAKSGKACLCEDQGSVLSSGVLFCSRVATDAGT